MHWGMHSCHIATMAVELPYYGSLAPRHNAPSHMKAPHTVSDADDGASAAERAAFVDSLTDLSSADTPIAAGLPSHPLRSPTLA